LSPAVEAVRPTALRRSSRRKPTPKTSNKRKRVCIRVNTDNEFMIGTIISETDAKGNTTIELDKVWSNDDNDGLMTSNIDQFVHDFCMICENETDDVDLVECNKCGIGMHRVCVIATGKQTEEELRDQDGTLFCKYCEENVSDDDDDN
jgi:hypothetical protein